MIRRDRVAVGGRRATSRKFLHGGVITALAVALVAAGSGVTFALWTSSATVTSQATTARLTLTADNFSNVAAVFKNHSLGATGSFTVKNDTVSTSTAVGDLNVVLNTASGGSAVLKAAIGVTVWGPVPSIADCTASAIPSGTDTLTGTWQNLPAMESSLAVGEAKTWCVRSQASQRDDLASSGGALSFQPQVTATLTVGQWTATAVKQAEQSTQYIYPDWSPDPYTWYQLRNVGTTSCVDVEGDVNADGTYVIDYACKAGAGTETHNQQWRFIAGTGDYLQLASRKAPALRMDTQSADTSAAALTSADSGSDRQQWQLQAASATEYQIVNKLTGFCLTPSGTTATGNSLYVAAECTGSSAQRFTLTSKEVPALASMTCAPEGSGATQRVRYSWAAGSPAMGEFLFQARLGTVWTTIGSAASGSTSVLIDPSATNALWASSDGERDVRIRAANDTMTLGATSSVWKGATPTGPGYLACSRPAAAVTGLACANLPNGVTFTWSTPAVGTYDFQARQGTPATWISLGTAAAGSTTASFTTAPGSLPNGTLNLRIRASGENLASSVNTVWKGMPTTGSSAIIQCVPPAPTFTSLTCTNSGNTSIMLGWGHQAVGPYSIELRTLQGGWLEFGTATTGATSYLASPGTSWSDGTRTLRVSYGSAAVEIVVIKATQNRTDVLRCLPPAAPLQCSADGYNAYFSWPPLRGYERDVDYRAFIGGIAVTDLERATGWDTIAQFSRHDVTPAKYGSGSKTVEIQQSISGGSWATVGTGTLVISSNHGSYLLCGT